MNLSSHVVHRLFLWMHQLAHTLSYYLSSLAPVSLALALHFVEGVLPGRPSFLPKLLGLLSCELRKKLDEIEKMRCGHLPTQESRTSALSESRSGLYVYNSGGLNMIASTNGGCIRRCESVSHVLRIIDDQVVVWLGTFNLLTRRDMITIARSSPRCSIQPSNPIFTSAWTSIYPFSRALSHERDPVVSLNRGLYCPWPGRGSYYDSWGAHAGL